MKIYYKATYTYKAIKMLQYELKDFLTTLGEVIIYCTEFLKGLIKFNSMALQELILSLQPISIQK